MRNDTIHFEDLITRPGLSCLWVFTAEAKATHLTARWIDSQNEVWEPASASTVSTLSTSTLSTFGASAEFFAENSATYSSARLECVLPLSQV
jgi:hypothetical protein